MFQIGKIPEKIVNSMMGANVWTPECPVPIDDLRLVEILHYDFDKNVKSGQLVVHKIAAENAVEIFKELHKIQFPIHTVQLIDQFGGDDELSMEANNSSCFNFRKIANSNQLSMHSHGLAIDVNPAQNPYIITQDQQRRIFPKQSVDYLDRENLRPGMVEPIVHIFAQHGFTEWGGNWQSLLDYHHFQYPREFVK